jgi:carbon storage regulator
MVVRSDDHDTPDRRIRMLVLTRRCRERILVPRCGISLTILDVQGNKVRVWIAAPADVAVFREEVWERRRREAPSPDELVGIEPPPSKG